MSQPLRSPLAYAQMVVWDLLRQLGGTATVNLVQIPDGWSVSESRSGGNITLKCSPYGLPRTGSSLPTPVSSGLTNPLERTRPAPVIIQNGKAIQTGLGIGSTLPAGRSQTVEGTGGTLGQDRPAGAASDLHPAPTPANGAGGDHTAYGIS